jgi:signal transduction histidine kinase
LEEIEILRRFAQLASIALDNAQLYSAAQLELAERKLVEEEIRQLNEELERRVEERTLQLQEAIKAREGLLSIVSHDLGNPLSIVKASVRMMGKRLTPRGAIADPTAAAHDLDRIDAATTRMSSLINDLTEFARLQAGQPLDLEFRTADLVSLVRKVVAEHQQTSEAHHIAIEEGMPDDLVGIWDPARLERVLDNLLSNAIKYSPQGGDIAIKLHREIAEPAPVTAGSAAVGDVQGMRLEDSTGAHQWAVLTVEDKGIGIPEADLPHIFEWFHRAENTSGRIKGTGIGLASARQIVEQHGGTLTATSASGQGSTFTVRLPL